jgi:hypothetical protein
MKQSGRPVEATATSFHRLMSLSKQQDYLIFQTGYNSLIIRVNPEDDLELTLLSSFDSIPVLASPGKTPGQFWDKPHNRPV